MGPKHVALLFSAGVAQARATPTCEFPDPQSAWLLSRFGNQHRRWLAALLWLVRGDYAGTLGISLYLLKRRFVSCSAHKSMLDVAEIIFQTCKTYLIQQGKFLAMLWILIALAMTYYFIGLQGETVQTAMKVLFFSIVGMGGSYAVGLGTASA